MEQTTIHTASALHALHHRSALTRAEHAAVDAHHAPLGLDAVRAPDDATLELTLLWCGLEPTPEIVRYVAGALTRDRARLGALAAAIEGCADALTDAEAQFVRQARHDLATERTLRIACTEPLTEADACVGALARALETAPHPSPELAHVCELLLALYRAHPDDARARRAVERIECLAKAHRMTTDTHPHLSPAALVLALLWCLTHRTMLLPTERGLDPHIERTRETWARIRAAALHGDADAIPIPVATAAAWSVDEAPGEAALRESLRFWAPRLPETLAAVECVWGCAESEGVCEQALGDVLLVARMRRASLDAGYRAPEDARAFLWFDVHQGARSADALERVAVIRSLHAMFERHGDASPGLRAHLHLDRAIEYEALGDNDRARAELEAAVALEASHASGRRDPQPRLRLAVWRWSEGDVRGARRLLAGLTGETARTVRATLSEYARHRKGLRVARRLAQGDACVEAACRVALAECAAGHLVAAERTARTACARHPSHALAWSTLARALCTVGRFRDAADPARRALALDANARRPVLDDGTREALTAVAWVRPACTTASETS